ncbi:MAG TPA: class I SAM-dependent methyltransferase [Candidatus Sulfopaludibacter sp.]|nr:class I SAM-dependent methyltransferase [Candidatus Sulfopaludibacter sp.]
MKIVPDDPYRAIPYPTVPMAATHPDRLAAVATLFGMTPAPVAACRVLEVGCGDGGNLIPMACSMPGGRFVGFDTAAEAVAAGQRAIAELGLRNIELAAIDLREFAPENGGFDYIVAHGLYSWVPADVREALLELCGRLLTPQGVAFVSYNALPGRHVRIMLREMMLYHTRDCSAPRERIGQARALLKTLAESRIVSPAWQPVVDDEIARLLAGDPAWLFHDDLAPVNDSFYLRDFAGAAALHGLQYLGDAEPHLMFDPRGALAWLGGDVLEREQYLDFLYFRRMRQTLLCRREVELRRPPSPEAVERLLFSAPAMAVEDGIEGLNSVRIRSGDYPGARVATALGDMYPLPAPFEDLIPYAGDRNTLREVLFALISSGYALFHVHEFPCADSIPERPCATRLARWQAERSALVTCAGHGVAQIDEMGRTLIRLLDGTRPLDGLARTLSRIEGMPSAEEIAESLADRLAWMASVGLLEA